MGVFDRVVWSRVPSHICQLISQSLPFLPGNPYSDKTNAQGKNYIIIIIIIIIIFFFLVGGAGGGGGGAGVLGISSDWDDWIKPKVKTQQNP